MTASQNSPSLAADFEPATHAQWQALVAKVLKGADFKRRLVSTTLDGIEIAPLYTRTDTVPDSPHLSPGVAPYARGSALRAAAGGWRIGQLHAESDPAAVAAAVADDAAGGIEVVTLQLEAPGQSGLAVAALQAVLGEAAAHGLRVSLQPGGQAIAVARALAMMDDRQNAVVSLGIDPLGTLARTGELTVLKADGTLIEPLPWRPTPATTLLVDSRIVHEAGGSEVQELAALLSTLVAYLRAAEPDLTPAQALPRIGLAMAVDADLFLSIAKLRAARRLVWRLAEACGAVAAAGQMPLTVSTSQRMMTRRDPYVNLLRTTAACTAAAMGGADDITVLPHTWALGRPDAFARRIARNIGIVLREEAYLGRVVDPAGGSWYVEKLTDDLARRGWSLFQEWEAEGGMLAALTSGLVHDQVAAVAEARAKQIATGRIELTGTSAYPQLADDGVMVQPWPAAPPLPTRSHLAKPLAPIRLAEPFERLRDAADACPNRPLIFLASLGTPAEHGARSTWITNFFAAGGIAVAAGDGYSNSADVGLAFAQSNATIACICGSDQAYGELGEAAAMALHGAGAKQVYLAGRPRDQAAALQAAGVDGFIYAGVDAIDMLSQLHGRLGVPSQAPA